MADYTEFPFHQWSTNELGQMLIAATRCTDQEFANALREEIKTRRPERKAVMAKSALKYNVPVQVRIPYDLHEQARAKSEKTGTTISHIVRKALEEWVAEK